MSIEDRLNRLKQIHKKPTRPPSGQRRQLQLQQRVASGMQAIRNPAPLDPETFQKEIEERGYDDADDSLMTQTNDEKTNDILGTDLVQI